MPIWCIEYAAYGECHAAFVVARTAIEAAKGFRSRRILYVLKTGVRVAE